MTHINFRIFASTVVPAINPDIVIHTGDITDGWIEGLKSGDIVEEWEMYKSTLVEHGYFNNSFWLDIRGNHDNSNQQSGIRHSYYNYSTWGHEGPVFNKVYTRPFGRYCFIGLDATLSPSPGVMMTYFGYVSSVNRAKLLDSLRSDTQSCNHTIVFTHYPTMYLNSPALHAIYRDNAPSFVLSGHVHATLGNRANVGSVDRTELQAKINPRTIECVVRDFKRKRMFVELMNE
ncbi:uncharacterized protein [Blastocystis hominis]|uniref:Calcineurin-like phosphoesterase domain-containing protein n=1 Tax=Blastocystis hominis TaxID=12968 RepID=D8M5K5_BLAHO|nr:uncharacterized protein [Blastocystis hominis]CBK23344.2 unnamed protein product [Blastocystis hominis]|eukprot:XP_012897392.1 uncharacterized protein [Blastocystis hominis]